jgi:molybdopterin molybdotransferase
LIRYADALATVRSVARLLPAEDVRVEAALGRVLAAEVFASIDVPRFANSQMDGFALRAGEAGERRVRGRIVAGDEAVLDVGEGDAVEIMTGAPMPPGADAVVKIEDVSRVGDRVAVPAVTAGTFVRAAGEDYRAGDHVASTGTWLTPEILLALAHTGSGRVSVRRRPRVAVIPTGRELEVAGDPLSTRASSWASSSVYLQTALTALGCDVSVMPIVRDEPDVFAAALAACRDVDVVLSTGAVSAGVHDFIPSTLGDARVHFHKMATRPAKPLLFAELDRRLFFGLPGNPISTAVACRFVVWPAIAAMFGLPAERPRKMQLLAPVQKPDGCVCFFKAEIDADRVRVVEGQGSHLVRPLASCDVWAVLPEEGTRAQGEVDVYPLQPRGR